jgi:hypothetical protein
VPVEVTDATLWSVWVDRESFWISWTPKPESTHFMMGFVSFVLQLILWPREFCISCRAQLVSVVNVWLSKEESIGVRFRGYCSRLPQPYYIPALVLFVYKHVIADTRSLTSYKTKDLVPLSVAGKYNFWRTVTVSKTKFWKYIFYL